jgi:hypothetical protein
MTGYSHVIEAPGSAGDTLVVDHYEGFRFDAPATCLVWHPTLPTDFHTIQVTDIEEDTFTLGSADDGSITTGMRIATLAPIDVYDFGALVTLDEPGYTLAHVTSPEGDEFSGSTPYEFVPEHEGLHTYRFELEPGSAFSADDYFFVSYTDAD